MFILIVGGGKVGSYLSRALLNQGHEVVVIEKDERKAKMLERLIDRQVTVVGDGCDPLVLDGGRRHGRRRGQPRRRAAC
jgi:trk system potassium uptake protein